MSESDRLAAVQRGLRDRARAAGKAAKQAADEREAAALRGKRAAYREAADMIETVRRDGRIHAKFRFSTGRSGVAVVFPEYGYTTTWGTE